MNICQLINYIEDNQTFGMNIPFISSSEAKNAYFMSGASRNEINGICIPKFRIFFSLYTILSVTDFLHVIHVHTIRHINDDVA